MRRVILALGITVVLTALFGHLLPEGTSRTLVAIGGFVVLYAGGMIGAQHARASRAWADYQAKRREVPAARRVAMLAIRDLGGRHLVLWVLIALGLFALFGKIL